MKKVIIAVILLIISGMAAFSQSFEPSVPLNQYAPTPKALEMTRYGHMPPDLNSGIYSYDIPIYTYEDKDFSIPVSLHYSSSGFQPARMSDEAGLHWTLMAGGAITREIVGVDDFSYYGLYGAADDTSDSTLYYLDHTVANPLLHYYCPFTNTPSTVTDHECSSDRYHFSFFGHSGSFVMTRFGNNYKIYGTRAGRGLYEVQWDGATNSFTIRTGDGYVYSFGAGPTASSKVAKEINWSRRAVRGGASPASLQDANCYVVTWLLDKITAPDGRTVTFSYVSNRANVDIPQVGNNADNTDDVITSFSRHPYFDGPDSTTYYKTASLTYTSYLSKIEVDKELSSGDKLTINFDWVRATNKEILDNSTENVVYKPLVVPRRRLNKIEVKRGSTVLQSAEMTYIQSGTRPLLSTVDMSDAGSYSMEYWTDPNAPLPGILTNALDLWGYYNGQDTLSDSYYSPFNVDNDLNEYQKNNGMNPSWIYARLGLLKKITYPTGGSTEITYESNQATKVLLRRRQYQPGTIPAYNGPISDAYLPSLFNYISTDWSFAPDCGGARVKTVTDNSRFGSSVYTFIYTDGIIQQFPRFYIGHVYDENRKEEVPEFSSAIRFPGSSFDQRHVAYKSVTEVYPDSSRVVTTFTNWEDHPDEFSHYREIVSDYTPATTDSLRQLFYNNILREPDSRAYQRGLPLTRKTYDNTQKLLREESWEYEDQGSDYNAYALYSEQYAWTARTFLCDRKPTAYTLTEWSDDTGQSITETTTYSYNGSGQLSQTSRTAGSHTEISSITYPTDITGGIYPTMVAAGYRQSPVERRLIRDGKLISGDLTTYQSFNGIYLPEKKYRAAFGEGVTPSSIASYNGSTTVNNAYKLETTVTDYDNWGNPLKSRDRDGVPTTYIWDSRQDKLSAFFVGAENGERTYYIRGAAGHTETNEYTNADPVEKTFSCTLSGSFSFAFTPSDTTASLTAKLDGNSITLSHIGGGAQGPVSAVTISSGSHTLQITCIHPGTRGGGGGNDPIETFPLTGTLSVTWPQSGAVSVTANKTDCFLEDFETSGGSVGYGFQSNKGRTSAFTRNVSVVSGRTYILDYMQNNGGVWKYVRSVKTPSSSTLYLSITASTSKPIDHVRFYPVDITVSSYTCWPTGELRCKVDGHGFFETYEYDVWGRLTAVRDSDSNLVQDYDYHYAENQTDHNYISNRIYTQAGSSSANTDKTITYYDGLGREKETVLKGAWLSGASTITGDIVSFNSYDANGRPYRTYLPSGISGNNGAFVTETSIQTAGPSLYGDSAPFSETHYEGSSLDRVRSEWGAGNAWRQAGKAVTRGYRLNGTDAAMKPAFFYAGYYQGDAFVVRAVANYPNNTIRVDERTDEDGRKLSVFTDAFGQILLERHHLGVNSFADTYFCYDSAGRLIVVLPPELSSQFPTPGATSQSLYLSTSTLLQRYGYFYRYDDKGQMIAKKLPGADWIYYIYDKGGRLVYSQDGNQRQRGEWSFTLSDRQGRECMRGTIEKTLSPFTDPLGNVNVFVQRNCPSTDMQDYGYLPVNFDLLGADVLVVNWYDDYNFLGNMGGIPSASSSTSPTRFDTASVSGDGCGAKYDYSEAAHLTGRMEKVLGETDGNIYLWSVLYYDDRGRVVQESHSTHRGGWQRTNTGYNFTDQPTITKTVHSDPTAGDMTERYAYTYDGWGRPLTVSHKLDNASQWTQLHAYAYDGAGRLVMDSRNGDTDLVTRYSYNVRSAVTEIKAGGSNASTYGATFTELLYYQNQRSTNPQTYVQWAGNVSAMDWKVGSNGTARRYDFTYDNLSRLTGASYGDNANGTGSYNRSYAYDKNGNITSITTPDGTTSLSYSGNQLSSGSNYTYDANGNLTYDAGLRRTIVYNVLNLPSTVNNGSNLRSGAEGSLYLYSASGVKLQSKAEFPLPMPGQPDTRSRKDYVGNLVYEDSSLKTILIDGGYVEVSGTTKNYRYFIQDHLGNNRLVADATGLVLQTNHYGPYGESLSAGASADSGNPYKYSGKEYDTTALSYDFGARYYVPTSIPRWTTMDPLAEKYYSISPYAYCAGNPINVVDPKGLDWFYYSVDGESGPTWNWHEGSQYNTGVKDTNGQDIILSGVEVAVVFNGSRSERLGKGDKLNGEGAVVADIVVYGANGPEDISHYVGYTMTSDADKYTPIAEGIFPLNYDEIGKSGSIPSHWTLNNRGFIPTMDGLPNNNPYATETTKGKSYKDGIFIHRTNMDGYAGGRVSTGCPLVLSTDWEPFEKHLIGHTLMIVQIKRDTK